MTKSEQWRIKQENKLWNLINKAFDNIDEPKKNYWILRLYNFYYYRFYGVTKIGWIEFLSKLTNAQAYGKYENDKARGYCLMVRDQAIKEYYNVLPLTGI